MLDVHPPHQAAHTWKDFFIHIATIVIGLLIAIGLEQTVEYFHHRHQLHQLNEDLHAETLRNLHLALANIDDCESQRNTGKTIYQEVVLANRDHRAPILHTTLNHSNYVKPATAAWTVAQQSGTLGLLPHDEAQRFVRVYSLVEQVNAVLLRENDAYIKLQEALEPGRTVLTPEQLKQGPVAATNAAWAALGTEDFRDARNALAQLNETNSFGVSRNIFLYGIEWSALHGSRSDEENLRTIFDAVTIYAKGGKAALLAKYPLPNDDNTTPTTPQQ